MTSSSNQVNTVIETVYDRFQLAERIEPLLVYDDARNSALILINVHHTRQISAHHGFDVAEEILKLFSQELLPFIKTNCLLMRSGNHEFAVLLQNIQNPGHCQLALARFERTLNNKSLSGKGYTTKTKITISGALYPKHSLSAEQLIQCAEVGIYQAETNGQPYLMYSDKMSSHIEQQLKIESDLYEAIDKQELELWYQPKINLDTNELYGVEALSRWNINGNYISPEIFIPIAEQSIMIKQLTHWVLNTSLSVQQEWAKIGLHLNMAVNISGKVVDDDEFVDLVEHTCGIWGVKPKDVTLEITETAMMQSFETNLPKLQVLRDMGFTISIDDFGTGYSSLEYFKTLPVNEVKIDKSFVINLMKDEDDRKMVSMIAGLSRSFGLKIVAEGVEEEGALEMLRSLGVHRAQGFHMAKPMPEDEFLTWAEFYLTNLKLNNSV